MLDNLLNWSLSQTETIQINKTNISALPILLSEIATLEEELVEKGIYLEYNLTNKEVLFADADHVRIIFRNLLTNAVRYTQKNGGKITIHANRLVDTYQFIFTNSPIVISSLGTSKATIKSTGLGLILSKEFALQNGGSLETIIFDELSYKATLFLPIGKL
jgi:signal transduction histidine kinase